MEFIMTAQQALGPEIMAKFLNVDEALRRLAASGSIDTTNLVKTKEQLEGEAAAAQEQQTQAQQMQMLMQGLKSPALAQVANNYTQPGAPYGPQYSEETGAPGAVPNSVPNGLQLQAGGPAGPTGQPGPGAVEGAPAPGL